MVKVLKITADGKIKQAVHSETEELKQSQSLGIHAEQQFRVSIILYSVEVCPLVFRVAR